MSKEFKIKWDIPKDYNPRSLFQKLPSPISSNMTEIYNYRIDTDGFYFIDQGVSEERSCQALGLFINEALSHSPEVVVQNL